MKTIPMRRLLTSVAVLVLSALGVTGLITPPSPLSAQEPHVTVYTQRQAYLIKPLFERFTARTGIAVKASYLGEQLTARLITEGPNTPADLVITTNFHTLYDLKARQLLKRLPDLAITQREGQPLGDPDNFFFALTQRARILYVRNDLAPGVTSYEDVLEPRFQGRVCTRPLSHGYNVALLASFYAERGADWTKRWLNGLKANLARKPAGNDRAQVRAIHEGFCDIAIGNSYYYFLMLNHNEQRDWATSVTPVFPDQHREGTHVNISGMAALQASTNLKPTLALMNDLLSKTSQEFYASVNYEFPARPDVRLTGEVALFADKKLASDLVGPSSIHVKTVSDLIDASRIDQ